VHSSEPEGAHQQLHQRLLIRHHLASSFCLWLLSFWKSCRINGSSQSMRLSLILVVQRRIGDCGKLVRHTGYPFFEVLSCLILAGIVHKRKVFIHPSLSFCFTRSLCFFEISLALKMRSVPSMSLASDPKSAAYAATFHFLSPFSPCTSTIVASCGTAAANSSC